VKSSRPQDAVILLVIALSALALVADRHTHNLAHQLHSAPRSLLDLAIAHPAAVVAVVFAALGVVAARVLVTRRTLGSRTRLVLLPSEDFDPSVEEVVRFAGQLARLRPTVRGWVDPRARALRVLIETDPAGRLRYSVEVPARSIGLLRTALATYERVELRDPEPHHFSAIAGRPRVARAELVLARRDHHPLARLGLDPDPLQSVAAAFARLRPEIGDAARIAVDVRPCSPGRRRRLRSRLLRAARHDTTRARNQPGFGDLLAGGSAGRGRATPVELHERRDEVRGLQDKLGAGEPLLELQLLLECRSGVAGRPPVLLEALLGCFDSFAAENHLRVAGLRIAGLGFLGSDLPGRRRRFDRRIETGLFRPPRRGLVTPSEIAGLLKPPTVHCHAPNVLRSGGAIPPPPPELPTFHGQPGLIPLGKVAGPAGERLAGMPVAETFFSYMAGRSRYGKTETAIGQFVHLARSGHGGLFLDPHADAIAEIKTYLTDPAVRERVVEINLADRGADQAQPAWNLFAAHGLLPHQAADKVEAVVDAMASTLRWDERNTRALNLATQAAQALVELAQALPSELAPTIFQLPTLLSDEQWRAAALPHLAPATRQFFERRFPRLPAEAVTAVTNLVDRLRAARPVAALLGSPVSTYDVREAMDRGLIVLACPGSGSTRDRLVANFLVYDVLHAAKGRAALPPERRKPFWVFLDELQTYDGPNLPALLEQSAKYGGRAFLFNQNPERLTDATLNAVTTNRSHLLTTTVNAKAAALLAREWGGDPTPQTVTQLERYTYLASVTLGARTTKPFLVHGLPAAELHRQHRHPEQLPELEQAITAHSGRRRVAETIAALDQHDERILRHLQRTPATNGPANDGADAGGAQQRVRAQRVARRPPKERN
jgi:hypothetical protein